MGELGDYLRPMPPGLACDHEKGFRFSERDSRSLCSLICIIIFLSMEVSNYFPIDGSKQ